MTHDLTKWTGVNDLISELTAQPRALTEAECSAVIARHQFNEGTIKSQIKEMDRLAEEVRTVRADLAHQKQCYEQLDADYRERIPAYQSELRRVDKALQAIGQYADEISDRKLNQMATEARTKP